MTSVVYDFLDRHAARYKMSFGLEYSSIVDWVAEFVPRRGHPLCRQYNGPWRAQATTCEEAIRRAIQRCEEMLLEEDGD